MSVADLIIDAQGYASETFNSASNALSDAAAEIGNFRTSLTSFALPQIPTPDQFTPPQAPQLQTTQFEAPTPPDAPNAPEPLPELSEFGEEPTLPELVSIDINSVTRPGSLGGVGASLPVINTDVEFPTAPDLIIPEAPVIVERTAPIKPDLLLPRFDALQPADLTAAPTDYAEQFTAAYREAAPSMFAAIDGQLGGMMSRFNPQYNAQMARIESKLSEYLNGGTALTSAVENAIYERSKDKVNAETRRVREAAMTDAAKRGFTMPDGATFSAARQARQNGADNNARASTEIAIKQAELEQQNMQFAVTTSTNLRTAVMSAAIAYHQNLVSINGQALEFAKSILNAVIEVYNTEVKAYQARLDGYRTEASVFETKLKGAVAAIDMYRAEIQAFEAMAQVDMVKIGVYRERINALVALTTMYRANVEAIVSRASLEKLKIDLYGEQVRAYAARASSKSAEWQGYAAAINGEEAKARVYSAQVQGYVAEWDAYKTRIIAKGEQIKAVSLTNQASMNYAAAQNNAYASLVNAEGTRVGAEIRIQEQLLGQYGLANQAAVAAASASMEYYKAQTQTAVSAGGLALNAILTSAQLDLARVKAVADTSVSAGSVYGQLASAALSGMNTLVVNSATE